MRVQPENRRFAYIMAGIVAAAIAVGIFSSLNTKSPVDALKAKLRAQGEKLTLAEVLAGRVIGRTNRMEELVRLVSTLNIMGGRQGIITPTRADSGGVMRATWQMASPPYWLGGLPPSKSPPTNSPLLWVELANVLSVSEPSLRDLREWVRIPDMEYGWSFDYTAGPTHVQRFVEKRAAAQWFSAAATSHLHDGRLADAQEDLRGLISLMHWHAEEWTLLNQMIRTAYGQLALQTTWAAMQASGWTEPKLAEFQRGWEQLILAPNLPRSIELERAQMVTMFEAMRRDGPEVFDRAFAGGGRSGFADAARYAAWRAFMAERDEIFYLQEMQDTLVTVRALVRDKSWQGAQPLFVAKKTRIEAAMRGWRGQMLMVSGMTMGAYDKTMLNVTRYETRRGLTIAALALRRHQLRHGKNPESLTALVPEFLTAVPVDYMDGKPLRYRLNDDGTFVLYSVGEDGKDDGGNPAPAVAGKPFEDIFDGRDAVWPQPTNAGPRK